MKPAPADRVLDWVRTHPMPNGRILSVCLWGPKGVGKTSWIGGYARQRSIGFRGYHPAHDNSGSDVVGLQMIDTKRERTVRARPLWLPGKDDPILFETAGVLFVDEINRAPKAVLQGLLEPIGEGSIKNIGWQCPEGWGFVCAANPPSSGYQVGELDEAMMDRLLHVPMGFDAARWAAWAGTTEVHEDILNFTTIHPRLLTGEEVQLPKELHIDATPRSMEFLSRLYEPDMDRQLLHTLALGLIGPEGTKAFFEYINASQEDKPVTAEEVIAGKVEKLGIHITSGKEELVEASQVLVLAMMIRYKPTEHAIGQVARFLRMLGEHRFKTFWTEIVLAAPHWAKPLKEELEKRSKAS